MEAAATSGPAAARPTRSPRLSQAGACSPPRTASTFAMTCGVVLSQADTRIEPMVVPQSAHGYVECRSFWSTVLIMLGGLQIIAPELFSFFCYMATSHRSNAHMRKRCLHDVRVHDVDSRLAVLFALPTRHACGCGLDRMQGEPRSGAPGHIAPLLLQTPICRCAVVQSHVRVDLR